MMKRTRDVFVAEFTPAIAYGAFVKTLQRYDVFLPDRCKTIAIKVNLCDYRKADSGATTDPELLGYLIDSLRDRYGNPDIQILENDASSVEAHTLFSLLGFDEMASRKGVKLVNVGEGRWITKAVPNGRIFESLEIPEILESSDLFINFSKLKTNALTKTTGSLKNIFAFLRVKRKSVYHPRIDEVLLDMNKVIRNGLCFVDGYIGMEGWGPAFGSPKRCELLIAGIDPVAVDACCARIMGFNPWFVRHIRWCAAAGLGSMRYKLKTDILDFKYARYKFRYNRVEHVARAILRRRFGAAG